MRIMPDNKYLVTPDSHQGVSHITPARLATLHRGTIAQNDYVLSVGQKFKTEIISNNVVRVYDGALIQGGIRGEIEQGDYRDVEISNGIIGMKRNYLIVCRWSVDNEDGRKTHQEIVAVEGAATEGEPQDPETNTNLIEEGAQIHDTVLYRVVKEGLDIVKIDPLFKVLMNVEELMEMQREINSKSIIESGENDNGSYIKFGNGTLLMWGNAKIKFTFASGDPKFGEYYVSRSYTRNFPVESLTPCSVQAIPYNNSYSLLLLTTSSLNKKDLTVRLIRSGGSDFESIICWQAIGRWR